MPWPIMLVVLKPFWRYVQRGVKHSQLSCLVCTRASPFFIIISHAPSISTALLSLEPRLRPMRTNGSRTHTSRALQRTALTRPRSGAPARRASCRARALSAVLQREWCCCCPSCTATGKKGFGAQQKLLIVLTRECRQPGKLQDNSTRADQKLILTSYSVRTLTFVQAYILSGLKQHSFHCKMATSWYWCL